MKNWLRHKLRNFLSDNSEELKLPKLSVAEPCETVTREFLRFTVTPANGGIIVQYYVYDSRKDENINHIHVIHDDDATTNRIAEIVTMALLKR